MAAACAHHPGSPEPLDGSPVHNPLALESLELSRLRLQIIDLESKIRDEDTAISKLDHEETCAISKLSALEHEEATLTERLRRCERVEARQTATGKLLQLQLTVATQLYGVAESLTQVSAVGCDSADASNFVRADILNMRDREIVELRRALKRQQNLVSDAHRQLLELSTRKNPVGAASQVKTDVSGLQAALAEQEMARMVAEARSDELQAQVSLPRTREQWQRTHALTYFCGSYVAGAYARRAGTPPTVASTILRRVRQRFAFCVRAGAVSRRYRLTLRRVLKRHEH